MRTSLQNFLTMLFAVLVFGINQGYCTSSLAQSDYYPNTAVSSASVTVDVAQNLAKDNGNIKLSINIDKPALTIQKNSQTCRLEGEGIIGKIGYPDLPAVVRWVMIPDQGKVNFNYEVKETARFNGRTPASFVDQDEDGNILARQNPPQIKGLYPSRVAEIGQPVIMRGVRMVKMTVYPLQWDADNGQYVQNYGVSAELSVSEGRGINEVQSITRRPSRDFDRVLEGLLVNPPHRDNPDQTYLPGGYVVVIDENAPEEVYEFVDWKRQSGHDVHVVETTSEMPVLEIREMLARLYRDTGFEYLVFMGSNSAEPPLFFPMDNTWYDLYYGQLEGDDFISDVAVGTFNCLTETNLICAIRRAISYQSEPFMDNTDWFTRAGVGVGACSVPQDLCPSYTGKWIAEVLDRNGFDDIQTSFYADNEVDDPSRMIEGLYNQNTNFIIVRAHEWNLEVDNIEPGPVYPFHFLVSSGTISPPADGAFNWVFRQGTEDQLKGPSAGFGHHSSPRTNDANALVGSLIQALFFHNVESYGWARNYALMNLQHLMVDDGAERFRMESYRWRYYGDPSQWCWRGVPAQMTLDCPENLSADGNDFTAIVTDANGEAVADAVVSMTQISGFKATALTNDEGRAYLTWAFEQDGIDPDLPINVTASADNYIPAVEEVAVEDHNWWVVIRGQVFTELEGNDDELLNPGESGLLYLQLGNPGEEPTPAIQSIRLTSDSPWVEVSDDEFQAEAIDFGSVVQLGDGFTVNILPGCPDGELLTFQVTVLAEGDVSITSGFQIPVHAPNLVFESADNVLEPGIESLTLLTLRNNGRQAHEALDATLEALSPFIEIGQNAGAFPSAEPMQRTIQLGEGGGLPFAITPMDNVVAGMEADFRLILSNDNFIDTVLFSMPVGFALEGDPLGPDEYGYVVFDDIDMANDWGVPPIYEWLEINPRVQNFLFEGEVLPLPNEEEPDVTQLVQMPFPFRYYGNEYSEISVCSNGWFAIGDQTSLVNQQNWEMPGINGAYGMIAVFWDRLRYENAMDGIFTFYDEVGGRFIIQWQTSVAADNQQNMPNIFQAIIYDPYVHPTITWDSMILFQYAMVNNVQDEWEANAHCTVGISSPSGLDGITYTYWNRYDPAAVELENERALMWRTISYDVPATVFGNITRWIDGATVEGAVVSASDGSSTSYTNDGDYRLVNVMPGELTVEVVADGYGVQEIENIQVEEHADVEQNFVLNHSWLDIDPDTLTIGYVVMPDSDYSSSVVLSLANIGNSPCSVMLNSFDPLPEFLSWSIDVGEEGFNIDAGSSQDIEISYNAVGSETGTWNSMIYFVNDSPVDTFNVPVVFDVLVSVDPRPELVPLKLQLKKPYPNPFNSVATVEFDLPKVAQISLALYNIDGRLIQKIADGNMEAGSHAYSVTAGDLASGVYFVKLTTAEFSMTERLLLIR